MRPLIDEAQVVINASGGRLQALKEISARKAQAGPKDTARSDDDDDDDNEANSSVESDSETESDSSDEDDNPPKVTPPPEKPNNQASILELDNILSGILSKSGSNSPASSHAPQSPTQAPIPPKKATPEQELDALLSGLQAKAKISAQSKPPGSPSTTRKPPASSPASGSFSPPTSQASKSVPSPSKPVSSPLANAERTLSVSGNWDSINSGGCSNSPDWRKNPQYLFKVTSPSITTAQVTLMQNFGVKQTLVPIGFYVVKAGKGNMQGRKVLSIGKDTSVEYVGEQTNFQVAKSITATVKVEVGEYVVIPATFNPGIEASFELEVTGNPSLATKERLELVALPAPPSAVWTESRLSLEWKGSSAGGSYSTVSSTWRDNPKVVLHTDKANTVTIVLARGDGTATSTFCGFYLFKSSDNLTPTSSLVPVNLVSKTTFLNGSEVVMTVDLAAGKYVILPCTYDANQEGKFTLSTYSKYSIKLSSPEEHSYVSRGGWSVANGNAGGCLNHPSWRSSPQYLVTSKGPTKVHILLEQSGQDTTKLPFIGVYVLKHQSASTPKPILLLKPTDVVGNTEFMNDLQVLLTVDLEGPNIILPSTFVPFAEGLFTLRISSLPSAEMPTVQPIPPWPVAKTSGAWKDVTAGGRYTGTSTTWKNNPRFSLSPKVASPTPIQFAVVLVQSEKPNPLGIGFYIFKQMPDGGLTSVLGKSGFVSGREVAMECELQPGDSAIILPSTFEPNQEDKFLMTVYSSKECNLVPV